MRKEAKAYLYHIAEMLGRNNHLEEKRFVEELSKEIPDPEIAKLEASLGELAVKLNDTIERLERLDSDADRDRADIEHHIDDLKEQLRSQDQQLVSELVSRLESTIALQEPPSGSSHASDSPDRPDELERTSSEVENNRRRMVVLQSENAKLREKTEDLEDEIEHLEEFVVEPQSSNAQNTADWVEDGSNEEPEDVDGEWEEEDEYEQYISVLSRAFTNSQSRELSNSGSQPRIWPGARYYCAQEGCNFTDGDWAGTRRAWWNEYKAHTHASNTGHQVAEVLTGAGLGSKAL